MEVPNVTRARRRTSTTTRLSGIARCDVPVLGCVVMEVLLSHVQDSRSMSRARLQSSRLLNASAD